MVVGVKLLFLFELFDVFFDFALRAFCVLGFGVEVLDEFPTGEELFLAKLTGVGSILGVFSLCVGIEVLAEREFFFAELTLEKFRLGRGSLSELEITELSFISGALAGVLIFNIVRVFSLLSGGIIVLVQVRKGGVSEGLLTSLFLLQVVWLLFGVVLNIFLVQFFQVLRLVVEVHAYSILLLSLVEVLLLRLFVLLVLA